MKKVSLSCAYCIHSVVSNSKGIRNPWLKDTVFSSGNNIPQVKIQLNAVHQYNLGTTNTDFKLFYIEISVFLVRRHVDVYFFELFYIHQTSSR